MLKTLREMFGTKKEAPIDQGKLIREFVQGIWGPLELCQKLQPGQGREFAETFSAMKDELEAMPGANPFKITQLENLMKRGIEKKICEAHGIPYIEVDQTA